MCREVSIFFIICEIHDLILLYTNWLFMHLLQGMQLTKTCCYYKAPTIFLFDREEGGGAAIFLGKNILSTSPDSEAKKKMSEEDITQSK